MTIQPRPELASLIPATHGGLDLAELARAGLDLANILDFSVNLNPAPPPAELRNVLARVDVGTYPDSESRRLRQAAARTFGVGPEQVLAGNGSSELIWLICLAYLRPGDTVAVRQPTFGEYDVAARIHGARVSTYAGTRPDLAGERLAFICNPNNPTGDLISIPEVLETVQGRPDTLFVVDEAYADFVDGRPTAISANMPANLIVLRSLTKFTALAGLRLGLAFGHADVIAALRTVKPPWNVNAMAQAAGEYALQHPELRPDLHALAEAHQLLRTGLTALGLNPAPTACNYFLLPILPVFRRLADTQPGQSPAAAVRRALMLLGCVVRDCTSFGLPEHIRISVGSAPDCERLIEAFRGLVAS